VSGRAWASLLGAAVLAAAGIALAIVLTRDGEHPAAKRPPPQHSSGATPVERAGTTAVATVAPRCAPGWRDLRSPKVATYGVVHTRAVVFRRPGGGVLGRFGKVNQNGFPTVFELLGVARDTHCRALWYRVQLPLRPNGVTGYVRPGQLTLGTVRTRILIDLSSRRLTLFRSGRPVLRTTVAIGASATPTPTGRFYVNQRLVPADPNGPFGPGAIGISAFSDVLTGWAQGGPVAIHGTNAPSSIGLAVSNGCIRVRNDVLRRLFAEAQAGTPVTIRS
jgi:lipoprotein-anchoring transpeptidase ErfK/SrfK